MTANKKYGYKDWWNGEISLIYAKVDFTEVNNRDIPPRVSWDEIKQTDILKIRQKQREIFKTEVSKTLNFWKTGFAKRYKNSKATSLLLNREIEKSEAFIFDPMPATDHPEVRCYGILFPIYELSVIKNYINTTKVNGADIKFDFVHSPNFIFQEKRQITPQIYAECCWLYVKWLKLYLNQKKGIGKALNETPVNQKVDTTFTPPASVENEPANPFPGIFKNGYAFNLFLELQKFTVAEKTIVADYSFIFHKMKSKALDGIHSELSHLSFIKFLKDNKYADLDITKLPFRNPAKKQTTFKVLLEKYSSNIENQAV